MDEMTALQALEELYGYSSDEWNEGTPRRKSLDKAHEVLRKALTPPTSEEVCKALSEELGERVSYDDSNKCFRDLDEYMVLALDYHGRIDSCLLNLKPSTYILLGRFYGGLK